jgi:AcrR family transcriptional regulator
MRSASSDDLTRKAVIRNTALELFAEHGHSGVSIRQIADAAGVSPALVIHHFGSKRALVEAVNSYVAGAFDRMIEGLREEGQAPESAGLDAASLGDVFARYVGADSPMLAYLRRLLLANDEMAAALFRQWYATTYETLQAMTAGGAARPTDDADVRAAFVLLNDLAVFVLRDVVVDLIGVDPLAGDGFDRWASMALDVYTHGIFNPQPTEQP